MKQVAMMLNLVALYKTLKPRELKIKKAGPPTHWELSF